MTGMPVYNVNNNCSTGSTALMLAKQIIEAGTGECVLALGFEKMERGSLSSKVCDFPLKGYFLQLTEMYFNGVKYFQFFDRTNPMDKHVEVMADIAGMDGSPITAQLFGNAGKEHMAKYGTKPEHFAKIAYKNHKHSANNP